MTLSIRPMTESDLVAAGAIVTVSFPIPYDRTDEVRRFLSLQPDGWLLATLDDKPVGTVGAIDYGPYAYVVFLAVHPTAQRRGIGLALMERIMAWLEARRCPLVMLDATDYGTPLYRKLGFVEDDRTLVYVLEPAAGRRTGHATHVATLRPADLSDLTLFDTPIFGAERRAVLASYLEDHPDRAFMTRDGAGEIGGYLIAQEHVLGPWIARSAEQAEMLLDTALALPFASGPSVIVPEANMAAIELLERRGFRRRRTLLHMRYGGSAAPSRRAIIYGQASLAIG
jgi:ribosomal protein S18 acetylase RimI-like enzyme